MQGLLFEEEISPDPLRLKMHSSSSQSHYQGVSGTLPLPVKHFLFLFFLREGALQLTAIYIYIDQIIFIWGL